MATIKISPAKCTAFSSDQLIVEKTNITATTTRLNLLLPFAGAALFLVAGVINSHLQQLMIGVAFGVFGLIGVTTIPMEAILKVDKQEKLVVVSRLFHPLAFWRTKETRNISLSDISEITSNSEKYPNIQYDKIRIKTSKDLIIELRFVDSSDDSKQVTGFLDSIEFSEQSVQSNLRASNIPIAVNEVEGRGLLPLHSYFLSLGFWTITAMLFFSAYFSGSVIRSSGLLIGLLLGFLSRIMGNPGTRRPLRKIAITTSVISYLSLIIAEYLFKQSLNLLALPSIVSLGLGLILASGLPDRFQLDMLKSQRHLLDPSLNFKYVLFSLLAIFGFLVVEFFS